MDQDEIKRQNQIMGLEGRLKYLKIDERAYKIRADQIRKQIEEIEKRIEELKCMSA